ncbi:peptidoglycan -binding protein [Frigidibacter sp. MR17.14]|uniref:peptidoglycan -binding protein n=1 Tax=Frigidibacter sp. MR17.14 TaxID=3126509 RepID=UPI003013180A
MALSSRRRRGGAGHSNIWPGFVDAVTTLLMVLMFIVTIFTVVQSVLRDRISSQDNELSSLGDQVASLADALGLERARVSELQGGLDAAAAEADRQTRLIATLNAQIATQADQLQTAQGKITDFEAQVAALIAERDRVTGERDGLTTALASARSEIDAQAEAARLAAARREALDALIADLRRRGAESEAALSEARQQISDREAARLADAAAAEALRERLKNSTDELTAMTLALEESRKRAEETLTLLAAAEAAKKQLEGVQGSEAERQAALLAEARARLAQEKDVSAEGARKLALLNEQVSALRGQLQGLQLLLDQSSDRDAEAKVQIESLGAQLNSALAQVAAEQRRRAALEEAERQRLEEEAKDLRRYRSEFFARLSQLLDGREGVRVVGDRFVFSSEVLFEPGSADLSAEGRSQIAGVASILNEIASEIPPEIDWIIRVDGHTDTTPLSGAGRYRDNWELSQGRALSVVRYMIDGLGFAPDRLAATGFGQYRPVAEGNSPEARAANRRIELKLTER